MQTGILGLSFLHGLKSLFQIQQDKVLNLIDLEFPKHSIALLQSSFPPVWYLIFLFQPRQFYDTDSVV